MKKNSPSRACYPPDHAIRAETGILVCCVKHPCGWTRELTINSQRGENEQLVVSVSDTGVGLPLKQADQIFNAFFTTKPHGTGMGLRISRSIVESHGGRLWAADNSPAAQVFISHYRAEAQGSRLLSSEHFRTINVQWIGQWGLFSCCGDSWNQ